MIYYFNTDHNPVMKLHFPQRNNTFLVEIDQHIENSRSSLSKHYFNMKNNPS